MKDIATAGDLAGTGSYAISTIAVEIAAIKHRRKRDIRR
jgi:hypothetical protein